MLLVRMTMAMEGRENVDLSYFALDYGPTLQPHCGYSGGVAWVRRSIRFVCLEMLNEGVVDDGLAGKWS